MKKSWNWKFKKMKSEKNHQFYRKRYSPPPGVNILVDGLGAGLVGKCLYVCIITWVSNFCNEFHCSILNRTLNHLFDNSFQNFASSSSNERFPGSKERYSFGATLQWFKQVVELYWPIFVIYEFPDAVFKFFDSTPQVDQKVHFSRKSALLDYMYVNHVVNFFFITRIDFAISYRLIWCVAR